MHANKNATTELDYISISLFVAFLCRVFFVCALLTAMASLSHCSNRHQNCSLCHSTILINSIINPLKEAVKA